VTELEAEGGQGNRQLLQALVTEGSGFLGADAGAGMLGQAA
jgi:hypothetical protein